MRPASLAESHFDDVGASLTEEPAAKASSDMAEMAQDAASFLKALSHEGRLMILCALVAGERSVSELEALLGARQAAVSQQLARLRLEGLVTCRREGKQIYYRLDDPRVARLVGVLHEIFCTLPEPSETRAQR